MSSGNPFGLADISHFGSFQRVGGKAGGFINKKFFHPSTLRNQEKLWKAMTADEQENRRQKEMEKRREEERQVEELRKQMYLSGQGSAGDAAAFSASAEGKKIQLDSEQSAALEEQKRRRAMLKKRDRETREKEEAAAAAGDDSEGEGGGPLASPSPSGEEEERPMAKSRYRENHKINGHSTVWGSWYSVVEKTWGFLCCKVMDHDAQCPQAPTEEEEAAAAKKARDEPKSKRARKAERKRLAEEASAADAAANGSIAPADASTTSSAAANAATESAEPAQPPAPAKSLMDTRMLAAAERRQKEKMESKEKVAKSTEKPKESSYLADLLADPTM
eukprot:gnl/TRDRNA2_/TRDRNA2_184326_c0_seq1.p1 gnl/TRDRNA2_/TRDRNA2_184326_c0~~gnl/TRDRNA2_/TRDRNA2_184326_c0_seq1.p1  ORF type:complete len:334 (+),score=101.49 gnl/TRDRNA2_/TRDRNA2_184326_c0_seq1:124-1125(+)